MADIGAALVLMLTGRMMREHTRPSSVQAVILHCLLPATVTHAVVMSHANVNVESLYQPALAVVFYLICAAIYHCVSLSILLPDENHLLLICELCSLATGLSSFPFIVLFTYQTELGKIAMMDIVNKIFGILVVRFMLVTFGRTVGSKVSSTQRPNSTEVISQLLHLICEPVIFATWLGSVLSWLRVSLQDLSFVGSAIYALSQTYCTVVFIFVGLRETTSDVTALLTCTLLSRAGVGFFYVGLCTVVAPQLLDGIDPTSSILFFQGACSFGPYSQIRQVFNSEASPEAARTESLALSLLTMSFPISISILTCISLFGSGVCAPPVLLFLGALLMVIPLFFGAWFHSCTQPPIRRILL